MNQNHQLRGETKRL